MQNIHIQMLDEFVIFMGDEKLEQLVAKSKKGASLIQHLLLAHGETVSVPRLIKCLWPDDESTNPENALKTLISRLRVLLNQHCEGFGKCIVADRGGYHWALSEGMTIDLYDVEDTMASLLHNTMDDKTAIDLYEKLISLYKGDLLQKNDTTEMITSRAVTLHDNYITAIYSYINLLKTKKDYDAIARVARRALDIDSFDDNLHMELMNALVNTGRSNDALVQYKHVMNINYKYLGAQPSSNIQDFYKQIVREGKSLDINLEGIRTELRESGARRGAFVCDYSVFKEIYNLQMRNFERLGSTLFLAVIMIGDPENPVDSFRQDSVMNGMLEILIEHLRKGDTITRFSPTVYALLLPTVNYASGSLVMERLRQHFYSRYPNSDMPFNYRVAPLSTKQDDDR